MNSKAQGGLITLVVGLLIIPSPIFLAWLSTAPGSNMWSEGDPNSGGAAIWLMFLTIPFGGLIALVGLILFLTGLAKK
jgi:TRAP-type C4-dicarboxylate transport system permease small subunit